MLSIWGEDSSLFNRPAVQKSKTSKVRRHPFASDPEWLREAIGQINGTFDDKLIKTDLTLLLPSGEGSPQPSTHLLINENDKKSEKLSLLEWRVSALALSADAC